MKFKKVLLEKNLKIEDLSEKLQKKITELETVQQQLEEIEKTTDGDSDELEEITLLKFKINALDKELVKSVKRFDPYMYKIRKERMAKINEVKHSRQSEPEESVESEQPETQEEPHSQEFFEKKEVVAPEQFELDSVPPISKTQHIKEELDNLQKTIEINPESFDVREEVIEVEPEIEEFEKEEDTKPRKMSKGLILMGVGAFLLTWGAVNFFRERRG